MHARTPRDISFHPVVGDPRNHALNPRAVWHSRTQYCFMNAAVQCMRHTPKLVDTIVQSVGDDTVDGLLQSFAQLLQQMCASSCALPPPTARERQTDSNVDVHARSACRRDDPMVQPDALAAEGWRDFVARCGEALPVSNQTGLPLVVPPTERQEQQDTGEFLDQLIDTLSTEKNRDGAVAMARASSSHSPTRPAAAVEARKEEISKAVTAAYQAGDHAAVHDQLETFGAEAWASRDAAVAPTSRTHLGAMFQGQQLSLQRCTAKECGRVTVSSADPFRILSLHLAATQMDRAEDGFVHLHETLSRQHKPHGLERGYVCPACKTKDSTVQRDTLFRLPEVLGIRVHRVDLDWRRNIMKKIDSSIKIEEELDLADCMINPDSPGRDYTGAACGTKYRLYAVVFHAGDAPNVGHYYATVRTTENQYVVRTGHGAAVREAKDASAKIVGRLPHGAVITLSEPMPAPTEAVQMVACKGAGLSGFIALTDGTGLAVLSQPEMWVECNDRSVNVGCSAPQVTEEMPGGARAAMLFYRRIDATVMAPPVTTVALDSSAEVVSLSSAVSYSMPDVFAGGTVEAKRGTHRVDICRILNKTPYPLELFWIAKDKTEEEMFDEANWKPQKRTTQPDAIHSFQNSYNGHCFGFSSPALGGKVTKHAAIIKLHEATKQWYTVHQALTEDGRSHPDGPLMIEGHSTQPDWTTYSDPSSALPAQQMSPNQVPAPAAAAASPVSGTGSTPVYNIGDAIEVWSVSANAWQKATVDKLLPNNELHVIYGDRYKQINLSDRSAWREASGAESLQRGHSNMGGSVDPTMIEQAVQEAMQMGFEEAAVRTMQVKLRLSSTTALIEALVADSAAI